MYFNGKDSTATGKYMLTAKQKKNFELFQMEMNFEDHNSEVDFKYLFGYFRWDRNCDTSRQCFQRDNLYHSIKLFIQSKTQKYINTFNRQEKRNLNNIGLRLKSAYPHFIESTREPIVDRMANLSGGPFCNNTNNSLLPSSTTIFRINLCVYSVIGQAEFVVFTVDCVTVYMCGNLLDIMFK